MQERIFSGRVVTLELSPSLGVFPQGNTSPGSVQVGFFSGRVVRLTYHHPLEFSRREILRQTGSESELSFAEDAHQLVGVFDWVTNPNNAKAYRFDYTLSSPHWRNG